MHFILLVYKYEYIMNKSSYFIDLFVKWVSYFQVNYDMTSDTIIESERYITHMYCIAYS